MNKRNSENDILPGIKVIFNALEFAAFKHRQQKRKGALGIPYINHPIEVCRLLTTILDSPAQELLISALLHDVLEDTKTKPEEIEDLFGKKVLSIVQEVTDNMKLPSTERRNDQILKARSLSFEARCIKIADKTCNINDILYTRILWPNIRKKEYVRWAIRVVSEIRDTHSGLIDAFYSKVREAEKVLKTKFL